MLTHGFDSAWSTVRRWVGFNVSNPRISALASADTGYRNSGSNSKSACLDLDHDPPVTLLGAVVVEGGVAAQQQHIHHYSYGAVIRLQGIAQASLYLNKIPKFV